MLNKLGIVGIAALMVAGAHTACADDLDPAIAASVKQNLIKIIPENMEVTSIEQSAMEDVYIVTVGTQTLYVHSKGSYLMIGDVYDVERRVNLGEERSAEKMAEALAVLPREEMILMGEDTGRYVTVFTDTDCVFCQRFHRTVPELQRRGLQVRYLMFPRAGVGSNSYNEAVSVWCSEDQGRAMTIAKTGGEVDPLVCENPVEKQYKMGQQLGVRGTPTMILDTGKVIPGFLEPDQLLAEAGMLENQ